MGNLVIKSSSIYLFLLIPGLYLVDMVHGFLELLKIEPLVSIGTVIRGGVFLLAIFVVFIYRRKIEKKIFFSIVLLLVLALVGPLFSLIQGRSGFVFDLQTWAKSVFLPLLTGLFIVIYRVFPIPFSDVSKNYNLTIIILGLSLYTMSMLSIGGETYGDYSSGFGGVFEATNDLSLVMAMTLVFCVYRIVLNPDIIIISLLLLAMVGFVSLGTRTALITTMLIPVMTILVILFGKVRKIRKAKKVATVLFLAPILILTSALFAYKAYEDAQSYSFQQKRFSEISEGQFPRALLLFNGVKYLAERPLIYDIFGEGATAFQRGVYRFHPGKSSIKRRMTEIDWLDFFGNYGLLFTVGIYLFILYFFMFALLRFIKLRDNDFGLIALSLLLYVAHSSVAGHGLSSPIPSTVAASMCAWIWVEGQRNSRLQYIKTFLRHKK